MKITQHNIDQQPPAMERLPLQTLLLSFAIAAFQILALAAAQSPAPAPSSAPFNITKILEKAGGYTTLIRLFKSTGIADRINGELDDSSNGMTIFAPTDSAFSSLKSGTLNGLSDQQKSELIQFHIIPNFVPLNQFQTVSNPISTQAGGTGKYEFPLNITTDGTSVNITTGINNASVGSTVYTDGQLAVYQVDKVLLPLNIFGPQPPAPAPAPAILKKPSRSSDDSSDGGKAGASEAVHLEVHKMGNLIVVAAAVIFGFWLG
ncbi:Fasciclin-like arabinogalactan protein 12 [Asimina triloba]